MTIMPLTEIADPKERLREMLARLAGEAHRRNWVHFYDKVMAKVNIEQVVNVRKYKGVATVTLDTLGETGPLEELFRKAGFSEARYITVRRRFEYVRTDKSLGECDCPKTVAEWASHREFLLEELRKTMTASVLKFNKDDRISVSCNFCAPDKEADASDDGEL